MSYKELLRQPISPPKFPLTEQAIEERATAKLLHDAKMEQAVERFNNSFKRIAGKLQAHVDSYESSDDEYAQIVYDFSKTYLDLREYFEQLIDTQSMLPREAMELTHKKAFNALGDVFKKHLAEIYK